MPDNPRPHCLPDTPNSSPAIISKVQDDYERFAETGLPESLDDFLADAYNLDLAADYAGYSLKNPWGKASGQLSMTARQVAEDVEAGLGFVVLKTVIAEDASGKQTMEAWAIKESRMVAEPIVGRSGEQGWTISWKGRGWWNSFEDYLQLIRDAQRIAAGTGTLIVPSCKYHLPTPEETTWKIEEYQFTTPLLLRAWREANEDRDMAMPLEKDFSPTLAGSDRSTVTAKILEWLNTVPRLVHDSVAGSEADDTSPVRLGLKIFNALFDDEFQLQMLHAIHDLGDGRPGFYIYGNRLFDPNREFDGHRGIAYGGPDLSDRNLSVMSDFQQATQRDELGGPPLSWSATGNIVTGKLALEYALRGATSFQLHTFFQLPSDQYRMKTGSKIQKALHELYFHPTTGFIVWMHHLANLLSLPSERIRFADVVGRSSDLVGLG